MRLPSGPEDIHLIYGARGQLARGLGRSYGDAALNSGGVIWDTARLQTLHFDQDEGRVRAGAGVSYDGLLRSGVPLGLFPPVTPGTKFVSVGGAIAADVHGKNHHHDGSIAKHIDTITMLTGDGEIVEAKPGDDLFAATMGGMGLTGIILEATIRLIRITSPTMVVDTRRTMSLAETLDIMTARDEAHRYSVAWVDLAHGSDPGRGVVTWGDHDPGSDLGGWEMPNPLATVPDLVPSGLVNRASVKAFNEVWFRKAPQVRSGERQTIEQFFYPLDIAGHWSRIYGRRGLIQHQMVVPFGHEDLIEEIVRAFQAAPAPPALAVLKRFGPGHGLLSFPIPGWTLAVDFPAGKPELNRVLDDADREVADAGGRVYLAKDSRLDGSLLPTMYPELDRWRDLADKADPMRRFRSDLDRRLGLRGPG